MIIQTRYRDLPWSELASHFPGAPSDAAKLWESEMRGREIQISAMPDYIWEGRNNFQIVGHKPGELTHVCSLCAEIGD